MGRQAKARVSRRERRALMAKHRSEFVQAFRWATPAQKEAFMKAHADEALQLAQVMRGRLR